MSPAATIALSASAGRCTPGRLVVLLLGSEIRGRRLGRAARNACAQQAFRQRRGMIIERMRSDIAAGLPLLDQLIAERPGDPLGHLFRRKARLKLGRLREAEWTGRPRSKSRKLFRK